MRIAIFEIEPASVGSQTAYSGEREYLTAALVGHELSFHEETLNEKTAALAADAEVAVVFVYSQVTDAVLAQCPRLRMVTTRSMGFNHLDLAACAVRGVVACRVPSYGEYTVAEHAFALTLALSRKIFQAHDRTEKADFDYHGLMGFDLHGKTLGIVGGGRIGLNVARMARGFEMKVLVYDPFPKPELAASLGFAYATMDELLPAANVVTLHVPYMPSTHHLIGAEAFAKMKKGALLINTARGGLVDTGALLAALQSGQVGGAGINVIEEEGHFKEEVELAASGFKEKCDLAAIVRDHALMEEKNVIVTPHIAWFSREAVQRILETTAENVLKFSAGTPVNVIEKK